MKSGLILLVILIYSNYFAHHDMSSDHMDIMETTNQIQI